MQRSDSERTGFTLIELLVVVSIIGLLIGILIPTLGAAAFSNRVTLDASNLRQLGVGVRQYLTDHDERLPQMWIDPATGEPLPRTDTSAVHVGTLFGGKAGVLPFYGLDRIGASRRPLNPYVGYTDATPDERVNALSGEARLAAITETELFRSPLDNGGKFVDAFGGAGDWGQLDRTMYNAVGTSYALNDHALDDDPGAECIPTLVPLRNPATGYVARDGRMPDVATPNRTWLIGTASVYNYDETQTAEGVLSDRGLAWFRDEVRASLLFVDLSVRTSLPTPSREEAMEGEDPGAPLLEVINETDDYTFLPSRGWWQRESVCVE